MTLHKDRPRKNNRKPMGRTGIIVTISIAAAVLIFVFVMLAVSGQSLF